MGYKIGFISEMYGPPTPPVGYGGISRSVHQLSEEFIKRGHEVTLFATQGSGTSGRLIVCEGGDLPPHARKGNGLPPFVSVAAGYIPEIDVWIDGSHHKWFGRYCKVSRPQVPVLCPAWNPNAADVGQNTVLQSPHMAEQMFLPKDTPCFFAGIPMDEYEPGYDPYPTIVCINVITRYKGTHVAVNAAALYNIPLRLYGPINDEGYFKYDIAPRLGGPFVEYMGVIGDERIGVLQNAAAAIMTPTWPEPGSLVTLESMACGCPVIATRAGCFPHYIIDGVNGYLVDPDPDSINNAYRRIIGAGREMRVSTRKFAEEKFDIGRWAADYEGLMARVIKGDRWA